VLLTFAALVAFALSYLAAPKAMRGPRAAPLLALIPLLALAPLGEVLGVPSVFMPSRFVLPRDLTLGRALLLLAPVAALVASGRRRTISPHRLWLAAVAGAAAVAIIYPGGLRLFIDAATRSLLEYGTSLWVALQFATVLALATVTALALPRSRLAPGVPPAWYARLLAPAGALVALLAGLLVALLASPMAPTTRYAALWCIPFVLVAFGAANGWSRRAGLRRWWPNRRRSSPTPPHSARSPPAVPAERNHRQTRRGWAARSETASPHPGADRVGGRSATPSE